MLNKVDANPLLRCWGGNIQHPCRRVNPFLDLWNTLHCLEVVNELLRVMTKRASIQYLTPTLHQQKLQQTNKKFQVMLT